jgi:hypothetical protein
MPSFQHLVLLLGSFRKVQHPALDKKHPCDLYLPTFQIYFLIICDPIYEAVPFHFKVPICDLWENGKIYGIDSCRDYICAVVKNINYGAKKSSFEAIN